jgi:MFS family permease
VLATTVFGWATGGVIGGIVADYIGRKRTMMLAILAYSLTTGLSAIALELAIFRDIALSCRRRYRLGMGDGPRSSPNCGPITRAAGAALRSATSMPRLRV